MKYIKLFENFFEDEEIKRLTKLFTKSNKEIQDLFFSELQNSEINVQLIKDLVETELFDLSSLLNGELNIFEQREIYHQDLVEIIDLFYKFGADKVIKKWGGSNHSNPLHYASRFNSVKIATYLIENKKLDIDEFSKRGTTALSIACEWGSEDVMKLLVENGADLNLGKQRPLFYCAADQNIEFIKYLIDAGADTDFVIGGRDFIAHCVFSFGDVTGFDIDFIKYLLKVKKIKVSFSDIFSIENKELKDYLIEGEGRSRIILEDDIKIYNLEELKSNYFTYIKDVGNWIIFHSDRGEISKKKDNYLIFLDLPNVQENIFSNSMKVLPLPLDVPYIFYNKKNDYVFVTRFDVEETINIEREEILKNVDTCCDFFTDFSEIEFPDHRDFPFDYIKNDEYIKSILTKDLKYDESSDSYNLYIKDYSDFYTLFHRSKFEGTIKNILNGDFFVDSDYETYESYMYDSEITKELESLLKNIIENDKNSDYEDFDSIQDYIENSDDELAEKIKDSIVIAYNRGKDSGIESKLWETIISEAYEWLTGKTYNKAENPISWEGSDEGYMIQNISKEKVIDSLFGVGQTFFDRLDMSYSDWEDNDYYPDVDLEHAWNRADIDSDAFEDGFLESLMDNEVLNYDSEIYKDYIKMQKKND
jgi:hypothetical protein